MKKLQATEEIVVCDICLIAIVNDDFSPIDYYYDNEEAEELLALVQSGMTRLKCEQLHYREDLGYSTEHCACCNSSLAGNRYAFQRYDIT